MDDQDDGKTLAPGFLIAVPQLTDPNFKQSVVLLLQQSDDGALGLVINRESPILLRALCKDHEISYAGDPASVRGRSVQPGGFVLYGEGPTTRRGAPCSTVCRSALDEDAAASLPGHGISSIVFGIRRGRWGGSSRDQQGSWISRRRSASCWTAPTISGWHPSPRSASTPH
jgi:putative transcriptional regulator